MSTKNEEMCVQLVDLLQEEITWQKRCQQRRQKIVSDERKRRAMHRFHVELAVFMSCFFVVCMVCVALAVVINSNLEGKCPQTELPVEPITKKVIVQYEDSNIQATLDNNDSITIITVETSEKPQYIVDFSEEERDLFEHIVAAESYYFWSYQDDLSICTVIINRLRNEDFPDNLYDVLTQNLQFSTYLNGSYKDSVVTEECRQAVEDALQGKTNLNNDVLWFCTKEYYDNCPQDDFFRTIEHVYTCRNVYFFEED